MKLMIAGLVLAAAPTIAFAGHDRPHRDTHIDVSVGVGSHRSYEHSHGGHGYYSERPHYSVPRHGDHHVRREYHSDRHHDRHVYRDHARRSHGGHR